MEVRYYQKQAFDDYLNYILNGGRRGLIVIPTGGGKSYIQAEIIKHGYNTNARILLLTHRKELIKQNYDELIGLVGMIDAGIYSAGLKSRHTDNRIIFAGIQSVHNKALHLGKFDIILVDEAHLINTEDSGIYRKFLNRSFEINRNLILIGLTATPYRMKGGMLNYGNDRIFEDIIHETTIQELMFADHSKNLDKKQYLCKLISKKSITNVDLSSVRLTGGEYNQGDMEAAFDIDDVVIESVKEIIAYTQNRKKVLVFASGIKHAEHLKTLLPDSAVVHSKNDNSQKSLFDFKQNKIKYLINVDILTTGFNEKDIDCLVVLRATKSTGLWVQILGRGTRMIEGKDDCLVLDFGNNTLTHGTIDKIFINNPKEKKIQPDPMVKECIYCLSIIPMQVRICPDCGMILVSEKPRHDATASEEAPIAERKPPEKFEVYDVQYRKHYKVGKPDSVRIDYLFNNMGRLICSEWISPESESQFARNMARKWVELRYSWVPDKLTTDWVIENAPEFEKPALIEVDDNDRFPKIVKYYWNERAEISQDTEIENYELDMEIPF